VRVIAATNQDLDDAMATGTFRRDLYYRLNVLHIRIPPLRERRRDIEAIADYCLDTVADRYGIPRLFFAPEAVDLLRQYPWPGNVRQLRNVVERLVVKRLPAPARAPVIEVDDLSAEITTSSAAASATGVRPRVSSAGRIDALLDRMFRNKESFWTVVYPMFSARDLTRDDLRAIVRTGLERTRGSYRLLVSLLNMPLDDYRRFLGFLRQHDCHVRFQGFRSPRVRTPHRDDPE
jgi:DNA-binding NtrC family response regulator